MFESISHPVPVVPRGGAGSLAVSWALHLGVSTAVVALPFLSRAESLPDAPRLAAFVMPATAAPPPPPPAPAPVRRTAPSPASAASSASPIPLEAPDQVLPERPAAASAPPVVSGGVEGGVPGGVVGGVVVDAPPPPPPPPPPPAPEPRGPIRVGGEVRTPELVRRVNPDYPLLAQRASVEGAVILEATVNEQGLVGDVRVLRSIPLLNEAAKAAVRQWQYRPLMLNGTAFPFIVTVTLTFNLNRG